MRRLFWSFAVKVQVSDEYVTTGLISEYLYTYLKLHALLDIECSVLPTYHFLYAVNVIQ
jgi:hypothetical protein